MPIRYDQYQLANSQRVRPFAGSLLPELTSVAGQLQERFDKTLDQEDMLSRAIKTSQAAPFEKDQLMLAQMREEYRQRIGERAKAGNYEDMYRQTMLDSRDFVDRYQPIAENMKRYQEYQSSLQQAVAKGDIKSPEKARRLLAASTQNYQGLNYDPVTGQVTNRFQGLTAIKDIDPTEKVDKWIKDVAPTVIGKEVRFTDGQWMKYNEGKWTTLTSQEIARVMDAGRRLDPEFDAWLQQEKQLAAVDVMRLTDTDVQNMKDGPLKQLILDEMKRTSQPASKVATDLMAAQKEQTILNNMMGYANKYVRDDRITGSGITGADPYNLQRTGKKLEDEAMVLSMPILQPEVRATIAGAEDLLGQINQSGQAVQASRQDFDQWKQQNGIHPGAGGAWLDANGNDVTMKYLQQEQVYKQAQTGWQNLQKLDAEARRRTGYGKGTVTPELMKKADEAAQKAAIASGQAVGPGGVPYQPTAEEKARIYQQAKANFLRKNSPGYAQYDKVLKEMTEQGSQLINVQNFDTKPANEQATKLFKNFVLNLDASGLKGGTQGLKWAVGDKAGQDLLPEDYKKVAADADFAGYAMDTDGQMKFFYNVGKVTQNAKGELVGKQEVVKMPALPGTAEMLIKSKQMDAAQFVLGEQINKTMNTPSGSGYIDVGAGKKVYISRIDKNQLSTGTEVNPGFNIRFPTSDGKYTEVPVSSVGEGINIIKNVLQRSASR